MGKISLWLEDHYALLVVIFCTLYDLLDNNYDEMLIKVFKVLTVLQFCLSIDFIYFILDWVLEVAPSPFNYFFSLFLLRRSKF